MNTDLIYEIMLGGFLGIIGQGIRLLIGLKKLHTSNTSKQIKGETPDEFNTSRLLLSLFIGFLAGALSLVLGIFSIPGTNDTAKILPIMAAGYAGTDFIEGIFNTYLSKITPPKPDSSAANNNVPADKQQLVVTDQSQKN